MRVESVRTTMLNSGDILHSQYRVVKVIGTGGMGAVYQVESLEGGRYWAAKELVPFLSEPAEQARIATQFQEEALLLGRLRHPGLPAVIDFFEEEGRHYLVMELIDGINLQKMMDQQSTPLNEDRVLYYAGRILAILDYLHHLEPPVIFRDLKPSNIMITPDDDVRLIDFGIAKVFRPDTRTQSAIRGVVSPGFAAIEQFGLEITDQRTDLYALGATMYYLLSRTVPPLSLHRAFNNAALLPLRKLSPHVTDRTVMAVEKMLSIPADDRFPTVGHVRRALGMESDTITVLPPPPQEMDTPAPSEPVDWPAIMRLSDGSEMVLVEEGGFWMGSPDGSLHPDEQPMHMLILPHFYIGRSPITYRQFGQFVISSGYQPQGPWDRHYRDESPDHPVCNVTLYDCLSYAQWAKARLPTEAEWEKAARGPRGFTYPWGDHWEPGNCNHWNVIKAYSNLPMLNMLAGHGTVVSGTLSRGASPCGALDMAGNVLEWTTSLYRNYPSRKEDERNCDPPRPGLVDRDCVYVLRGGAWNLAEPDQFRTAARFWSYPAVFSASRGFRLALTPG